MREYGASERCPKNELWEQFASQNSVSRNDYNRAWATPKPSRTQARLVWFWDFISHWFPSGSRSGEIQFGLFPVHIGKKRRAGYLDLFLARCILSSKRRAGTGCAMSASMRLAGGMIWWRQCTHKMELKKTEWVQLSLRRGKRVASLNCGCI